MPRSLSRILKNRKAVPVEKVEIFRTKIDNLFKFQPEQFSEFVMECKEIMTSYPDAKNWLKWYLHPNRATVIFKACRVKISTGEKGRLLQLSTDTNAQENIGRQIQRLSLKKKISVGEAIDLLWRFVSMFQNDRKCVFGGQTVKYGSTKKRSRKKYAFSTHKISMKKPRYSNDGRAPDTNETLFDNNNQIVNEGLFSFGGIPWGFTTKDGRSVRATCRMDSIMTNLTYHERHLKKNGSSLVSHLHPNHLLRRSFEYIEQEDFGRAREVLIDLLFKDGYEMSRDRYNWFGDINDCLRNVFSDIVGCTFLVTKRCVICNKDRLRKKHSAAYPLVPFSPSSTDPTQIFCQLEDDLQNHSIDRAEINHCVLGTPNCNGPSKSISKTIVKCAGNLLVLAVPRYRTVNKEQISLSLADLPTNDDDKKEQISLSLADLPTTTVIDGKRFKLRSAIGGDSMHFVSFIKQETSWLFYDGMDTPMIKTLDEKYVARYPICIIMYELLSTDVDAGTVASDATTVVDENSVEFLTSDSDSEEVRLDTIVDDDSTISSQTLETEIKRAKEESKRHEIAKNLKELSKVKRKKNKLTRKSITKKLPATHQVLKHPFSSFDKHKKVTSVGKTPKSSNATANYSSHKKIIFSPNTSDEDLPTKKKRSKLSLEIAKLQTHNVPGTKETLKDQSTRKGKHQLRRKQSKN